MYSQKMDYGGLQSKFDCKEVFRFDCICSFLKYTVQKLGAEKWKSIEGLNLPLKSTFKLR